MEVCNAEQTICKLSLVVKSTDILLKASPKHEKDPIVKILHMKIFQRGTEERPKGGKKRPSSSEM